MFDVLFFFSSPPPPFPLKSWLSNQTALGLGLGGFRVSLLSFRADSKNRNEASPISNVGCRLTGLPFLPAGLEKEGREPQEFFFFVLPVVELAKRPTSINRARRAFFFSPIWSDRRVTEERSCAFFFFSPLLFGRNPSHHRTRSWVADLSFFFLGNRREQVFFFSPFRSLPTEQDQEGALFPSPSPPPPLLFARHPPGTGAVRLFCGALFPPFPPSRW